jgi:putative oxidoreductase
MSLIRVFYGDFPGGRGAVGLLILRVAAGLAFVLHGWSKIQHPFSWMGPDASTPGILQALAAVSEFGGGIAWILGALMPLSSLGILCTMVVATHMHAIVRGDPFVGKGASYEPALIYLCVALLFLLIGPGRFSVDALLFRQRERAKE